MNRSMATALLLVLLAWTPLASAQDEEERPTSTWVMFWNVENLYEDESAKSQEELEEEKPLGLVRRGPEEHRVKLHRLREVIRRVDWGRGPDVIGLCEVENARVVEALLAGLPGPGYAVHHAQGEYNRRNDVALAVRAPVVIVGDPESLRPPPPPKGEPANTGRSILHAKLGVGGKTLHVFVAHLKSKRSLGDDTEGSRRDEVIRARELAFLWTQVEAVRRTDPAAYILLMGDFNEDCRDSVFRSALRARLFDRDSKAPDPEDDDHRLLNLGGALQQSFPGGGTCYYDFSTRRFQNSVYEPRAWTIIDNFFVSESLGKYDGLYASAYEARIGVSFDLLNHMATPQKLARRRGGLEFYPAGVSDHLPILLRLMSFPNR